MASARRQARLVDDLLDVFRIIAGKSELALRVLDWQALVREVVETVRPEAEAGHAGRRTGDRADRQGRHRRPSAASGSTTADDGRWVVAVDGREIATKLDEAYDAWAHELHRDRPGCARALDGVAGAWWWTIFREQAARREHSIASSRVAETQEAAERAGAQLGVRLPISNAPRWVFRARARAAAPAPGRLSARHPTVSWSGQQPWGRAAGGARARTDRSAPRARQ